VGEWADRAYDALYLDDYQGFTQTTPDAIWIPIMAREDRVILTGDHRVRGNYREMDALMVNKAAAFLLPQQITVDALKALVEPRMSKIIGYCNGRGRPLIYILMKNGVFERRDTEQYKARWRTQRREAGLPDLY